MLGIVLNTSLAKPPVNPIPVKPRLTAQSLARLPVVDLTLVPHMVNIPAGCFQMGSSVQEPDRNKDELQHRVCVRSFKLAQHEATIADFNKFIIATKFATDAERNMEETGCWSYQNNLEHPWDWWQSANWRQPVGNSSANLKDPVSCVSYNDVMAYIHWLNQRTGQAYRLPTEVEWEYAARAGSTTDRYWGNQTGFACSYANVADTKKLSGVGWPLPHACDDGFFFAAPVASFRANKFGLHDMLGNVLEWTCSAYQEHYAGAETGCTEQANAEGQLISIRGGAWNADPARVRSAARNSGLAWTRQANLGFRLVRVK